MNRGIEIALFLALVVIAGALGAEEPIPQDTPVREAPAQDASEVPKQETPVQKTPRQKVPNMAFIQWEPIKGVTKYKVEIRKKDEVIFSLMVSEPKIEISLPHGEYQYRIGIVHKFNKIYKWSDWYNLTIIPPTTPEIISVSPKKLDDDGVMTSVTVRGNNFFKTTEVSFNGQGGTVSVRGTRFIDEKTLVVDVEPRGAAPGSYDLIVTNPGSIKAVGAGMFSIRHHEVIAGVFHHFGVLAGYYTPDVTGESLYGGFGGIGFFYEFHSPGKRFQKLAILEKAPGLYAGVDASYFYFAAPGRGFSQSHMLELGAYAGYSFALPPIRGWTMSIAPVAGYREYFRWYSYNGSQLFFARPILMLGCAATLDLPKNFFAGVTVEYNTLFDNDPISVFGFLVRAGYKM